MGMTVYEPPGIPRDEPSRELAVRDSGALAVRDDPVLHALVEEARQLVAADAAAVSIVYREWQYMVATQGIAAGVYGRRASLCGHAIVEGEAVFLVQDTHADPRFAENPNVEGMQLRFYVGAPLLAAAGVALGTLCAFGKQPRAELSTAERERLIRLAEAVVHRIRELRHPAC